ncbi:MAG: LPS export ABC transporter periplasmic protein LptC [Boseongicola sp.]
MSAYIGSVMITADNAYSRFIFWMKVLLPLAALAILSTLFLVSETLDPEKAIPYADVDVRKLVLELGITEPAFSGVTSSGARISMAASSVRPTEKSQQRFVGEELVAHVELPNGTRIDIASPNGVIDSVKREAILEGGARLVTSQGYTIETERLISRYDVVMIEAAGAVMATGPGGQINAGRMTLEREPESGDYQIVFQDGVRLIYMPQP